MCIRDRDSIATARAFGFAKAASPALDTALKQIGNNADARPEIRLEALVAAAPLESVSTNPVSYTHLDVYKRQASALGMTENAVRVALHRLRRQFGETLREEVAQTVESADAVDEEIRHLFAAISS